MQLVLSGIMSLVVFLELDDYDIIYYEIEKSEWSTEKWLTQKSYVFVFINR